MPRLYVLSGPDIGATHDVEGTVVLGRARDIGVPVRGKSISRRHAELRLAGGRWVLRDLGSANGTWLGPRRLKDDEWLEDGDEFRLGEIELRFRLVAPEGELPAAGARAPAARPVPEPEPEPAPAPRAQPELELEGDWSTGPVEPSLPLRSAPRPRPAPAPARAPAGSAAGAAARRAAALGATRAAAPAARHQRVLQYNRVEQREGLFAADLEQQPIGIRWALYLLAFAFFAALAYGAFELTTRLRDARADDAPLVGEE
jgi:predicted component of type VI protein secretion system